MSMIKHFIYCRKSTEDEDRQMLSIDAQLSELNAIAIREGLTVVQTFVESKSAKEPGREVFNEMIRRIEKGEATGILSWKLDRLARNFDDGGKIIGMLQRGAIQEIRTFEKSYLPSDNVLLVAVELGMANQYVRDLSMNIRRGIREKIRRGIFCGKAPLGYMNDPKSRTIEPHPDNFSRVKSVLEKCAGGGFTLTAIQKELTALGLVGDRSRKPQPLSSVGKMLTNPFYYGVFQHKGELHQGVHLPMISQKTFDDIQQALVAVGRPRKLRGSKGFLFLNFATCGSCGFAITGERHTKKKSGRCYHYYRCTHKSKARRCENRTFIREEDFQNELKRNVGLVTIPLDWKEEFLARVETWESEQSEDTRQEIQRVRDELARIKAKIDRLNNGFADGSLELAEFKELKNPLVPQKAALEEKLIALERSKTNRLEPLRKWIIEANEAETWASENNWLKMKDYLRKVGSNRLLSAETVTVSFTKPASLLAETTVAVRSTTDVSTKSFLWWSRGESNP